MSNASIYLAPQHEAKLRASHVDPTVAAERGYYSITDLNALRLLAFSKLTVPPALAIPMYDYAGQMMTIVRPDAPRIKDGRPVKYDRPGGQRNIIDIHPRVRPVLQNPTIPLWITEAPLKADALISQGQFAVGGVGCWFFRTKSLNGGKVILPDFQHIAWNNREVRIVFDSDVADPDKNIEIAERRLALYLTGQGAKVKCTRLPMFPDGSKMGVDDYFATGKTVADLMQLLTPFVDRASRDWSSEEAISALSQLGYSFQMNTTTDAVEVNGKPITDAVRARMLSQMRDLGYKGADAIENAYTAEASDFSYHPVQDWMHSLSWDGRDRFLELSTYFRDAHGMITDRNSGRRTVFDLYFRRWAVGAVAKVMQAEQNMMLVLDGPQRLGKSYFSSWLCSPLPGHFIEAPIRPDDKDYRIRLVEKFIWEVAELDATTRRQDVSALKSFITERTVTVRRPYGHHDVTKPAMASLIGTINNSGGFLADPTGSSRFLVVTLERINFKYATEINVTQLWAQAVTMYRAGEPWALSADERKQQDEINEAYQTDDPLEGALVAHFILDVNEWLPTNTIVEVLAEKGHRVTPHALGVAARKLGLVGDRRYVGSRKVRGFRGIQEK